MLKLFKNASIMLGFYNVYFACMCVAFRLVVEVLPQFALASHEVETQN